VLEREAGVGREISSRNSEVIHAGLYYAPGSLKARLYVEGPRALYQYWARGAFPHRRCGKLVVATGEDEDAALLSLHEGRGPLPI
jgi:L-2-hydroxyglutarate oxidase LhgO